MVAGEGRIIEVLWSLTAGLVGPWGMHSDQNSSRASTQKRDQDSSESYRGPLSVSVF